MLDSDGDIIANKRNKQSEIISEADVSDLHVESLPQLRYNELVEKQLELLCINAGVPFDDKEACRLTKDPIRAHLAEVNGMFEPEVFDASINDYVQ